MRPYEPETELFTFREPSREEALSQGYRLTTIVLLVIGIPLWLASAGIMLPAAAALLLRSAEDPDVSALYAAGLNVCATFLTLYAVGRRNETVFARSGDMNPSTLAAKQEQS